MITFEHIAVDTLSNIRIVYRGTILRIIYELRVKPGIMIHDDYIAELDQTTKVYWPTRLDDKDIQIRGLLSYQEVKLAISVWSNIQGVTLRFPRINRLKYYMNTMYGPANAGKFEQRWYEESTGTQVECQTNTDELYNKIVIAYKRYLGKLKKINLENADWKARGLADRQKYEAAGTWGGIQEVKG